MTYRELTKDIGRMTAEQLDSEIVIEFGDSFYPVESVHIASGEGLYLYKGEPFLSVGEELPEKEEEEEEE